MAACLKACAMSAGPSSRSAFATGGALPAAAAHAPAACARGALRVEASRVCDLTGKKANNGFNVSFSHRRTKTLQHANLQLKRVFWEEGKRWIALKLSTKAIKSLETVGLEEMAARAELDLSSLPYVDMRPERTEWVAAQKAAGQPLSKPRPVERAPNPAKQAAKAAAYKAKVAARGK